MKRLILAAVVLSSLSAHAATAYWTGRSSRQGLLTYCEYNYLGSRFWQVTTGFMCPVSIELE